MCSQSPLTRIVQEPVPFLPNLSPRTFSRFPYSKDSCWALFSLAFLTTHRNPVNRTGYACTTTLLEWLAAVWSLTTPASYQSYTDHLTRKWYIIMVFSSTHCLSTSHLTPPPSRSSKDHIPHPDLLRGNSLIFWVFSADRSFITCQNRRRLINE